MSFRKAGWEKVETRKHVYKGVFPSAEKPEEEIMLYGTVDYGMKDGSVKNGVEWAALMNLTKVEGEYKLKKYQVWIVSVMSRETLFQVFYGSGSPLTLLWKCNGNDSDKLPGIIVRGKHSTARCDKLLDAVFNFGKTDERPRSEEGTSYRKRR